MSIVAPISATGAALPVIVGVATGERPSPVQAAGLAVAVAGVILASREISDNAEQAEAARLSIALAIVAALGFGGFLIAMDAASEDSVPWALLSARGSSVALLLVITLVARAPRLVPRAETPGVATVGILDLSANGLFALASTKGLLSVRRRLRVALSSHDDRARARAAGRAGAPDPGARDRRGAGRRGADRGRLNYSETPSRSSS